LLYLPSIMKRFGFKHFIGFTIVAVWFFYSIAKSSSDNRKYFSDLHLTLKGEVLATDVPDGYNGFGILRVKIIESNISSYDPRGERKNYYCIIKNGIAEIYQIGIRECEIGDTVTVDAGKMEFTIYKKDGTSQVRDMVLYTNEFFYKYLQKHQKI
jgi:hypothetical protein